MPDAPEISIHAAREGGDLTAYVRMQPTRKFQSTPPVKAATAAVHRDAERADRFQSTPPVKAATNNYVFTDIIENISIHAAREGGDAVLSATRGERQISIHAAREGGDL